MRVQQNRQNPSRWPSFCFLPAVLLFLSTALVFSAGCSASYNGERLFWSAQQLSKPLLKDPNNPPQDAALFTQAIEAYRQVIEKAPGTVWAARAQSAIGSLSMVQKEYAKARAAYALVLQNHNAYKELVLAARVGTAKAFELENDWSSALKVYSEITDYHPWSTIGLEAPLYIAAVHRQQGRPEEATKASERAVRTYMKLIPEAPTPTLGIKAKGYLSQAYQRVGKWDQAAKLLEELLAEPKDVNRPLTLLMLGSIYQTRLHQPNKAGGAYSQLIQEFPNHPFVKIAKLQLDHLNPAAGAEATVSPPPPPANP